MIPLRGERREEGERSVDWSVSVCATLVHSLTRPWHSYPAPLHPHSHPHRIALSPSLLPLWTRHPAAVCERRRPDCGPLNKPNRLKQGELSHRLTTRRGGEERQQRGCRRRERGVRRCCRCGWLLRIASRQHTAVSSSSSSRPQARARPLSAAASATSLQLDSTRCSTPVATCLAYSARFRPSAAAAVIKSS